ncbi:relaxin-3-like [Limosa lapponica baueri]|uniref:Relaxin-3-like n=1 Tax=Limosa lapponica baueri TaxID=1758121 RepID=A0A2I0TZX0_LIMLA|nr:relaxin-3-like [Limosa lapponica baueri]
METERRGWRGPAGDGYGVKLCGREFIRAVIFTCGGSRWKRLSLLAMEPAPAADSARTANNKLLGNFKLQSILGPEVEQLQRSSPFLGWETFKDLYSLNDYNEYVPVADDFKELVHQVEEAVQKDRGGTGIANPVGSNSYLWARYPRRKRESLGLAGMCCKWGCTKAEISTICRV